MRTDCILVLGLVLLLVAPTAGAGPGPVVPFPWRPAGAPPAEAADAEDYARAEQFLPQSVVPALYNVSVEPHWIGGTSSFWYERSGRDGTAYVLVEPLNRTRRPAFDHAALAGALANATGEAVDASALPLRTVDLSGDGTLRFTAMNRTWAWEDGTLRDRRPAVAPADSDLVSPDGRLALFLDGDNLALRDLETGTVRALTLDGTADHFYARIADVSSEPVTLARENGTATPYAAWSPDSRRVRTFQVDQQNVTRLGLLQYSPENGTLRPISHSYRYSMPGENVAQYEPVVVDVANGTVVRVDRAPWPHTSMMDGGAFVLAWWSNDAARIHSLYVERGERTLRLLEEDPVSGAVRELFDESGPTYLEANLDYGGVPNIRVNGTSGEFLWFSERSGWGHLYRYGPDGGLMNAVTSGDWVVRALVSVEGDRVYFTAGGREPGRDPYYRHLYRVRADGGDPELLTPEDADHEVSLSPDGRVFVDTYSRVDAAPRTVVRAADGTLLLELEEGDISYLTALGWRPPEQVAVKAADGATDLYGLLFLPSRFDPAAKYPLVDSVYPGPQSIVTGKAFPGDYSWNSKIFWKCQALAELGFAVVNLDGPGTPYRSKAFHDAAYGRMGDAGGLADHVSGIAALGRNRSYLDLDRVGIYGHSGGGFMTAQALLTYPGFYTVGVASAGNQDNRLYGSYWGEKYEGLPDGDNYLEQVTGLKAANLTGHLLLVTGDLDDNVHPSMSLQLANALVDANRTFDMLVLPNRNHHFNYDPYFIRRQFDYFVLHLQNATPPDRAFDVPWIA